MEDNNIVIISENRPKAEKIVSQILLLRSVDSIGIMTANIAKIRLNNKTPDCIVVHVQEANDIDFIKELRQKENLSETTILMLADKIDTEILCRAFDARIDDFMSSNAQDAEIIIRIMWSLNKKLLKDSLNRRTRILKKFHILDEDTNFYHQRYTQEVFEQEVENIVAQKDSAVFMILTPDIESKSKITSAKLAGVIKQSTRLSDIVGFAPDGKFYIILCKTNENGAKIVYDRIKKRLENGVTISAAASGIKKSGSFAELEKFLNKQLAKALKDTKTFIVSDKSYNNENDDLAKQLPAKKRNLNFIKQVFLNKIEKVIPPAFFKMQTIYEAKAPDVKIFHKQTEERSVFILRYGDLSSKITMNYNDYTKISVEIVEKNSENTNTNTKDFEISEITSDKIENIIQSAAENFIKNLKKPEEDK